jgi:ribosomal protein L29
LKIFNKELQDRVTHYKYSYDESKEKCEVLEEEYMKLKQQSAAFNMENYARNMSIASNPFQSYASRGVAGSLANKGTNDLKNFEEGYFHKGGF